MLNLLQSNICGSNNANNTTNVNDSHFLGKNLQQNGQLKSEQFEENMKIEHVTSGNRIAFIKIRDDVPSATSVKHENQNRTNFHKFFLQKYPNFFRQYCLCMHRKVEPDDLNTVPYLADDVYKTNSFLLNRTPIIPITVDPKTYVISQLEFSHNNYHKVLFTMRKRCLVAAHSISLTTV